VRGEPPFASFFAGHIAGIHHVPQPPPVAPAGPVAVRMEQVTLRYPGGSPGAAPALDGVTLDVPAGSLVGVTGPVGAGKSTLARALMGLYPLEHGSVLLGDVPVEALSGPELAVRAGYLPQDPFLFSGTIRENVLLVDPADAETPERLRPSVEIAALTDDLAAFPDDLDTEIGESGIRASGGQRQRIALARALAAQPHTPGLLVLDDPFSAVDVDTEARIAASLQQVYGPGAPPDQRATVVLCSHRLSAFPRADQIVVLDSGRIVEQGTHADLLQAGGLYARMYRAQQQADAAVEATEAVS